MPKKEIKEDAIRIQIVLWMYRLLKRYKRTLFECEFYRVQMYWNLQGIFEEEQQRARRLYTSSATAKC